MLLGRFVAEVHRYLNAPAAISLGSAYVVKMLPAVYLPSELDTEGDAFGNQKRDSRLTWAFCNGVRRSVDPSLRDRGKA